MATQTVTLAKSETCVAILTYDDAALTASQVTMANITGNSIVTFWITVGGVTQWKSVPPRTTSVLVFSSPLAVTLSGSGVSFASFNNFGIGVGVDTSKL